MMMMKTKVITRISVTRMLKKDNFACSLIIIILTSLLIVRDSLGATTKKPPKLLSTSTAVATSRTPKPIIVIETTPANSNVRQPKSTLDHGTALSPEESQNLPLNELLDTIFANYHKELVPIRPTAIKLDLLLLKIKSTIEKEGIFESVVALFVEWRDKRMRWNPRDYDNVTILAFESDKVWLPDIAMTNSADHLYSISKDTRFVVRVTYEGDMKFVPTGTARTWCDLRLLTFPFDIQTCTFEFESWSLDSSTMTFNKSSAALVDDAFSSPQWELCRSHSIVYDHFYNFTGEIFTRVRFEFVARRKSTFYIINLIFPCATLSMIQLLVFVIPSTDSTSDRVGFGTTNLLTLVVFQTIVTAEMPKSSDAVTALSKYIIALIIISAVGIFESVIAERLLRTTTTPPPGWAMKLVSIIPLLWGTQMPSGINQMILEGGDCSKDETESSVPAKPLAIEPPPPPPPPMVDKVDKKSQRQPPQHSQKQARNGGLGGLCCSSGRRNSQVTANSDRVEMVWVPVSNNNGNRHNVNEPRRVNKRVTLKPRHSFSTSSNSSSYNRRMMLMSPRGRHYVSQVTPQGANRQYQRRRSPMGVSPRGAHFKNCDWYRSGYDNQLQSPQSQATYVNSVVCVASDDLLGCRHDYAGFSSPSLNSQMAVIVKEADSTVARKASDSVSGSLSSTDKNGRHTPPEEDSSVHDQLIRIQNGILWGELVTKVDHIIFIACFALAVCIPGFLFLPLMAFTPCNEDSRII